MNERTFSCWTNYNNLQMGGVACSNNEGQTLNFQGESENWKVNFASDTGSSSHFNF